MNDMKTVAQFLADAHRQADPATQTIKFFPDAEMQQVRLLEVSGSSPTTGEVLPLAFRSDPLQGIDYQSVVILLSPTEWKDVGESKLALPPG